MLPDADTLLELEPEELAGFVLQILVSVPPTSNLLQRDNFCEGRGDAIGRSSEEREAVTRALIEAWIWLEREGLIAPRPKERGGGGWVFVTRRGRQVASPDALQAYRQANMLPRRLLHAKIAQKIWATFLRGDYDTAVFQAFKEVEVAVRSGAGLSAGDFGTSLMRRAFAADQGPLADPNALPAEREALAHLFAGAIGLYKNPHSHRTMVIDALQAVEMIVLASHLLAIVETRSGSEPEGAA